MASLQESANLRDKGANLLFGKHFAENSMKMKEIGRGGLGSATVNTLSLYFWAWGKSQAKITEILEKLGNLFQTKKVRTLNTDLK